MFIKQLKRTLRFENFLESVGFFCILHFLSFFYNLRILLLISLNFQSHPIFSTPFKNSHFDIFSFNTMLVFLIKLIFTMLITKAKRQSGHILTTNQLLIWRLIQNENTHSLQRKDNPKINQKGKERLVWNLLEEGQHAQRESNMIDSQRDEHT